MFVTNTHPLVWYSTGKLIMLSRKVLSAFQKAESAETLIYVPAVVFWEIALLAKQGFDIVSLETSIIWQSIGFNFNNDSFDKIIVANAIKLDIPLITKHTAITESNLVKIYW